MSDDSIRLKTPAELEADRIAADLAANRDKAAQAHRAQEASAMALQHQWADRSYK